MFMCKIALLKSNYNNEVKTFYFQMKLIMQIERTISNKSQVVRKYGIEEDGQLIQKKQLK